MDYSFFIFLSSGLFLGWSLGANDAANIFGTAVGTKMVRFRTAAVIASVFVMLGAVFPAAAPAPLWLNWAPSMPLPVRLCAPAPQPSPFTGWSTAAFPFPPLSPSSVRSSAGTFTAEKKPTTAFFPRLSALGFSARCWPALSPFCFTG